MKKVLLFIICLLFLTNIKAEEKFIKLVNQDDKVVYESNLNNGVFIDHTSMVPGDSYTDEVRLINDSGKQCKVFFQVKTLNQNSKAELLLDNIFMKVYLDNKLIYNGKSKGQDYYNNGISLQNAIELKTFNSSDKALLKVETSLSKEYSEVDGDLSLVNFVFLAQYDDKIEEIIPVPITDKNEVPYWVFSIILCLIGTIMLLYSNKNKKEVSGGNSNE